MRLWALSTKRKKKQVLEKGVTLSFRLNLISEGEEVCNKKSHFLWRHKERLKKMTMQWCNLKTQPLVVEGHRRWVGRVGNWLLMSWQINHSLSSVGGTVCWIGVKVAVLCTQQYMSWNIFLIKVLNNFWYFEHPILTMTYSEAYLKHNWRNCLWRK